MPEQVPAEAPTNNHYDALVIGGGINGVAVAQAIAARGNSVLLLEKSDLAAGTSHASSKLIHGGLRYLENFEFTLVYEALRERALMLRNAPDLVKLRDFYIPVYQETRRPPWLIFCGLCLYALCDALRPSSRFRLVPRHEWARLDGLKTEGLRAVFQYRDAQTDDRLLTRAVMNSALELGATLQTGARFLNAHWQDRRFTVNYLCDEQQHTVTTGVIVNAAGPWVNEVNQHFTPAPRQLDVDLIQGTHIVVDSPLEEHFYYVESPRDGRAVFVMPWYGKTLIGTTEARFTGEADDIEALDSSVRYLLNVYQHYFPRSNTKDTPAVTRKFAGARVLPAAKDSAFKRSRETILYWQPEFTPQGPALCSIYGGKLTAWRATAEKVVKTIEPALPAASRKLSTRDILLQHPGVANEQPAVTSA